METDKAVVQREAYISTGYYGSSEKLTFVVRVRLTMGFQIDWPVTNEIKVMSLCPLR